MLIGWNCASNRDSWYVELSLFADIPFISLRFDKRCHCFQGIFKTSQVMLVALRFIREFALQLGRSLLASAV